ncbi:MAG: zinc finger domain-containing protein [Lactimicrobium massiliense]
MGGRSSYYCPHCQK